MSNTAFWNTAHKRARERTADPLGLDALREAMADCLVPHLTGLTRHADDYLWILVGLRWARSEGARLDAEVWELFRKFERGLKQYLFKFTDRHDFLGVTKVRNLCEQDRPIINKPILDDERATGLLGNYIASLRAIELVEKTSLAPTPAGEHLIRRVAFETTSRTFSTWNALKSGFAKTERDVKGCCKDFGGHLFRDDRMRRAATAMKVTPSAHVWGALANRLTTEQRRIASSCATILRVEEAMIVAFGELLSGQETLTTTERAQVRSASARTRNRDPIPDAWAHQPIAKALEVAWGACATGRLIEKRLVELHVEVVHVVRGNDPWITALGDESIVDHRPVFTGRDFRLRNLKRLVAQTKWTLSGHRA